MTTSTDRIEDIFRDARELQADALEMLAQGRIRNAAEKDWGATKRATDALVLARNRGGPETRAAIRMLSSLDEEIRRARLVRRYHSRQVVLHFLGVSRATSPTQPRLFCDVRKNGILHTQHPRA